MIVFRCHACGEQTSVSPDLEIAHCPTCGVELRVPRARGESLPGPEPRCTRLVYVLVGVFLGAYGVHNFLAGYITRGATQLAISIAGMLVALLSFVGAFAATSAGGPGGAVGIAGCGFFAGWIASLLVWIWAIIEVITIRHDADGVPMRW